MSFIENTYENQISYLVSVSEQSLFVQGSEHYKAQDARRQKRLQQQHINEYASCFILSLRTCDITHVVSEVMCCIESLNR